MQVWRQTGKLPELLEKHPTEPPHYEELWLWTRELFNPQQSITYTEIKAWSELSGRTLGIWHLERLMASIRFIEAKWPKTLHH